MGDVFLEWATKYGAKFKTEQEKGASLEYLANMIPEPSRAPCLYINGAEPSMSRARESRIKASATKNKKSGKTKQEIGYAPRTSKDDKYRCEHILGPSAKEPGSKCGYIAKFWHDDHNVRHEDCEAAKNVCLHSRCAKHSSAKTIKTRNAQSRQKARKSGNKVSVNLGDSKKLEKEETGELLKDKPVNNDKITDIINGLRKKNKKT